MDRFQEVALHRNYLEHIVHSAIRSNAPLSLLGTVVRGKMMKTATAQVISPPSVIVSPCFLHMNHVLDIRLRCCLQQLDSANARRPHAHANACTRWLVISPRTHTRSPRCTRCTSDHMCVPAATAIQQTQRTLSPAHPRLNTLHLASISLANTSDAALRPSPQPFRRSSARGCSLTTRRKRVRFLYFDCSRLGA